MVKQIEKLRGQQIALQKPCVPVGKGDSMLPAANPLYSGSQTVKTTFERPF